MPSGMGVFCSWKDRKMNRIRMIAVIMALLSAGSLAGCTVAGYDVSIEHEYLPRNDAFTINGTGCGSTEAKLYLSNYKNLYGNVYGLKLWDYSSDGVSMQEYVKSVTIDELSRIFCMEQIAKEQGIELEESDRAHVSRAAGTYYASLTKAEIDYMEISQESLEEYYTRYALAEKLYRTMTDGEAEEVSDDDARVIRIRQILVRQKEQAKEVKKQLDAGKDFPSVANSYNEAEATELTVSRGQLSQELEEVVFDLDDGAVSKQIHTSDGYYFFQCVSKFEGKLTEANKEVLLARRKEQRFTDAYSSFIEKSEREFNEEFWEELSIENEEEITTDSFFSTFADTAS